MIVIVAFLLALGPLVFVHELGHFLAAKGFGIGVPVFSLGFGPRLFGFRRKETDYRVSAIPLGGYVRLAGDESDENRSGRPEEFLSRPRVERFVVYVAGATFNIVFAVLTMWVLLWVGGITEAPPPVYPVVERVEDGSAAEAAGIRSGDRLVRIAGQDVLEWERFTEAYGDLLRSAGAPVAVERGKERIDLSVSTSAALGEGRGLPGWLLAWPGREEPVIAVVEPNSPAERAGLEIGDRILGVDGRGPVQEPELRALLEASAGRVVRLSVERAEAVVEVAVTPRESAGKGRIGAGFRLMEGTHRDLTGSAAFVEALRLNAALSTAVLVTLKRMITREESVKNLSGPIEIAQVAKRALVAGVGSFFSFLAFVSLQLGVFNLLPIPVLDGGHILVLGAEAVMRRDLSDRVKERVMQAGLVFLLFVFAMVMYNDLAKSAAFQFLRGLF